MNKDPHAAALLTATRAELLDEHSALGEAIRADPQLAEAAAVILAAESALSAQLADRQPGLAVETILKRRRRRKWVRLLLMAWWGIGFPLVLILLLLMLYAGYTIVSTLLF